VSCTLQSARWRAPICLSAHAVRQHSTPHQSNSIMIPSGFIVQGVANTPRCRLGHHQANRSELGSLQPEPVTVFAATGATGCGAFLTLTHLVSEWHTAGGLVHVRCHHQMCGDARFQPQAAAGTQPCCQLPQGVCLWLLLLWPTPARQSPADSVADRHAKIERCLLLTQTIRQATAEL
jgi:hypothetical protein